jgi:hypothetical protein
MCRKIGVKNRHHWPLAISIRAAACENHEDEDEDVQAEEEVRVWRAPRPDGMKEFEVVFRDHKTILILLVLIAL